jgi:1,4-alpha-glucan branching enzyme
MTSVRTNGVVEFRFFRADAANVAVAGDFTQWQQRPIAMRPEGNGWWVARVPLEAGEYRFRYVADGQWFTDFAAHGVELKKQTWNSVLLVPESQAAVGVGRERQAMAA